MGNQGWNKYLSTVGMHGSFGRMIMRVIGVMDIAIACVTLLFKPNPAITTWAALWAFSTALIRPLSGEEIWAFVERAGNWATPLALLWTQLQASGAADPLVKQALALLPPSAPLPFAPATPFLEHMLAALVVAIALFFVSLTLRVVNGKGGDVTVTVQ